MSDKPDAPDLKGELFAGFAQRGNRIWKCRRDDREPIKLAEGDWEIISFVPVNRGVAVLGLADKLNSTGAVTSTSWNIANADDEVVNNKPCQGYV